jgi:hypothetical protein
VKILEAEGAETSATISCRWCGRAFMPRRGGSAGKFCCARHRTLFWTACRKWAERAVSLRLLSVADLNADPAACTLLTGVISPAPILEVAEPGPLVQVTSPEEAADLLDNFLIALLDLSGDEWDAWMDVAAALPDELYDRIDHYIERCLQEP